MPLADYDEYVVKLKENRTADFQMSASFSQGGRLCFASRSFLPAPATPTTSIALLSGTVTTAQTTNLPTAALTRFTSGEGVMIGLCIWSNIGGTATTVTVSYTNQAGTPGQISTATQIGGNNIANLNGRIILIPLAAGDTGVRSVESVTLAGTTGTAGNIGVCLFKSLAIMAMNDWQGAHAIDAISTGGFVGALAEVHPDACLSVFGIGNVSQAVVGSIILAEV